MSLKLLHVGKLHEKDVIKLDNCALSRWRPMNHIDNWQIANDAVTFNICGVDPYLICEGVNVDACRYPYITIAYATNDLADQAQMFYMTDSSMTYTNDKSLTFNISNSHDKYTYKFDLSDNPSWKNIVTLLRLDPAHYPAQYEKDHVCSQCAIYDITVSSIPVKYESIMDYTGRQNINQWEYCCYEDGIKKLLVYDSNQKIWTYYDGSYVGIDYQKGTPQTSVSRNWRCPADGKYNLVFSGKCNEDTWVSIILDADTILYKSDNNKLPQYKRTIQLQKDSVLQFISGEGCLSAISIEIQKDVL